MKYLTLLLIIIFNLGHLFALVEKPDLIRINLIQELDSKVLPKFRLTSSSQVIFNDSLVGIRSLYTSNNNNGFLIQKTIDGGYNWDNIYVDTVYKYLEDGQKKVYWPKVLINFEFLSDDTIILYCSSENYRNACYIITSTDMGTTWHEEKYDSLNLVYYYKFNEKPIMKAEFAISDGNHPLIDNKYFIKSENTNEWERIIFPDEFLNLKYSAIDIVDSNTIYFNFVIDTAFNPIKWEYFPYFYKINEKRFEEYPIPKSLSSFVNKLKFRNTDDAMAIAYKPIADSEFNEFYTYILRTTNRWKTWDTLFDCTEASYFIKRALINGINYFDSLNIIVYGDDYNIVKTSDGGLNWKVLSIPEMTKREYDSLIFYGIDDGNLFLVTNITGCSWPSIDVCFLYGGDIFWSFGPLYRVMNYPNSIESNNIPNNHLLFPNPATSTTTLKLTEELNGKISAVDLLGNETPLWSGFAPAGDLDLDVSHLPAGIYTILINNGYKTEALKMIKE